MRGPFQQPSPQPGHCEPLWKKTLREQNCLSVGNRCMAEAVMERCVSQMGKQRRGKEKSRKVPQGVRTSAKSPVSHTPSCHLDGWSPRRTQSLTRCYSRSSLYLLGHTLGPGGSRGTAPRPHTCFHAGPTDKELP